MKTELCQDEKGVQTAEQITYPSGKNIKTGVKMKKALKHMRMKMAIEN